MSGIIELRHLAGAFPDYESTFAVVDAILTTDSTAIVTMPVSTCSVASQHVYEAFKHYAQKGKTWDIRVYPVMGDHRPHMVVQVRRDREMSA